MVPPVDRGESSGPSGAWAPTRRTGGRREETRGRDGRRAFAPAAYGGLASRGGSSHGVSLVEDQAHLIDGFVALARDVRPDAVLIAGDVYDRAVPPPDAVTLFDAFLARVAGELGIPVVVIAGNHDSADRPRPSARGCSRKAGSTFAVGSNAWPQPIELADAHGPVDVVAIPYVDPPFARAVVEGEDGLRDHDACQAVLLDRARRALRPGRRSVCVAHAFVAGSSESDSERPLVVGGGGLVARSRFEGFDYVALGHLHRPQRVGADHVRYAGSLMPYSFGEAEHAKSVALVEIAADGAVRFEPVALTARRGVRVVEGTLDELLAETPTGVDRGRLSAGPTARDRRALSPDGPPAGALPERAADRATGARAQRPLRSTGRGRGLDRRRAANPRGPLQRLHPGRRGPIARAERGGDPARARRSAPRRKGTRPA